MSRPKYKVDDWVEVLGVDEILATLDSDGCLDGMPFMPEMTQFCGHRFQVYKSAHKGCDTVFPVRSRWFDDAVHLRTRCDGHGHAGCQARCLLYWKGAWLKRVDGPAPTAQANSAAAAAAHASPTEAPLQARMDLARLRESAVARYEQGVPVFRCQATQLPCAGREVKWWDVRQYWADYTSGNVGLWTIFQGAAFAAFQNVCALIPGARRPLRRLYDSFRWVWRGAKYPRSTGTIPVGAPTPTTCLNLQPGETVRVKSHDEILETISVASKNRGMWWDAECVPYCGGTYKVLARVDKIIEDKHGRMVQMKNPCIILDGVVCKGRYSDHRMFCPRELYPYWREIWLERVEAPKAPR
jgi:hypothetical protein